MDQGMVGGIAGGIIGVMGGVIGTSFMIMNTNGPRERAVAIRGAIAMWLWMIAMVAWLFLMPRPWNQVPILLTTLPLMFVIPLGNRRLARAQAEDEADRIGGRETGTPRRIV